MVQSALVNHITCTLLEENNLDIDSLEALYQKVMVDGFTNQDIDSLGETKAIKDMEKAIATFSTNLS